MPRVQSAVLESFIECRTSPVFTENNFALSKGRSSTLIWRPFEIPEDCNQDAHLMTTAVAVV